MTEIKIDIWSDIACPWCYVGEKIFNQALIKFKEKYPKIKVNPIFHAYMIDPRDGQGRGGLFIL